jgi:hypothetical protein
VKYDSHTSDLEEISQKVMVFMDTGQSANSPTRFNPIHYLPEPIYLRVEYGPTRQTHK